MKEEEWDFYYALIGDKESEKRLKDAVFYYGLRLASYKLIWCTAELEERRRPLLK